MAKNLNKGICYLRNGDKTLIRVGASKELINFLSHKGKCRAVVLGMVTASNAKKFLTDPKGILAGELRKVE